MTDNRLKTNKEIKVSVISEEINNHQIGFTDNSSVDKGRVVRDGETDAIRLEVNPAADQIKVYKRRWIMLAIFAMVSMTNNFHWIQFSIITDVIASFYGVTSRDVDWTSLIYMIIYIPLIFPGAWIMDRWGLRVTLLIASFGTALGSWIKVLAVSPDRFYVALIGQAVCAVSQVFVLGVPPNVAAVWFGPDQVSSACAIGVFGNQLGCALGFLLPPILVKWHPGDIDATAADLSLLFYILAGVCTALFLLVVIVFEKAPPLSPTVARVNSDTESSGWRNFYRSIKRIVTNRGYILLLVTYGINTGVFYAISTLLNQTVLANYPGEQENAGRIGLTIILCGMVGSVVCGIVLDRTHRFKETTLIVYILAVVGMAAYTFTFMAGYIGITFAMAGTLGFFMTGYLAVGFEFAAELTYPEPEVTSSGLLNASAQLFGIIFTYGGGWLLEDFGDLVCNGTLGVALLVGAFLTILIRPDLRRQKATQVAPSDPVL